MKTIFLKSISLRNFKGIKSLDLDFTQQESHLHGANGTGKTTVFDAFTWLLFGKDSSDRKDFNIKTLQSDGRNIEKLEHEVSAVLSVQGQEVELRRIYKENWVTKRGEATPELKGHETLYYINEVPKKAGEYTKEISEIVQEQTFKLLTNPAYFPNMKWQEQREVLLSIIGQISDEEIISGSDADFTPLFERMQGKTIQDYKLQISATKKKLKADLEAIPTRIDEAERSKPEAEDFGKIEKEIQQTELQLKEVEASIEDKSKLGAVILEQNKKVYDKINEIRRQQQKIVTQAQREIYNQDAKIKSERQALEREIQKAAFEIGNRQQKITTEKSAIDQINKNLDQLRKTYTTEFEKQYQPNAGKLICPIWNIACTDEESLKRHADNEAKAQETFNEQKAKKLEKINAEGKATKDEIVIRKQSIKTLEGEVEVLSQELEEKRKRLLIYPSYDVQPKEIQATSLPEWQRLNREAEVLESEIKTEVKHDANEDLKAQKTELNTELVALRKRLANRDIISKQDYRIQELNAEMKRLAQQISDFEKDEFSLETFIKLKITEVENRINAMFGYVRFKLFEQQINGAEVETCQAMINGVPYADANTASKINAGLDIIRVLSQHNGVTAPIFIDNRESVSEIIEMDSQVINLVVNPEYKTLTLK